MNLYWNDDCVADPTAPLGVVKTADIVKRLATDPIDGVELVDPMDDFFADGRVWLSTFDECALEHVRRVHSPEYVEAVRTGSPQGLAESSGIEWSEHLFPMGLAHVTGVMAAVHHALESGTQCGSVSPNMNRARRGSGDKGCIFNGIAAAVSYAITGWKLQRILVIDCDRDWATGTEEILASQFPDRTVHVDITCLPGRGYAERDGNFSKAIFPVMYADKTEMAVQRMFSDESYDFIIYNAGMNPVEAGVESEELAQRERMVRWYIGDTPAVFLSGGGTPSAIVSTDALVDLHLLTLNEWARYGRLAS